MSGEVQVAANGVCHECGGLLTISENGDRHWWHNEGCPFMRAVEELLRAKREQAE